LALLTSSHRRNQKPKRLTLRLALARQLLFKIREIARATWEIPRIPKPPSE